MLVIESVYVNEWVLVFDLFNFEFGFNEDVIVVMVLFFIKLVQEGVVYLGDFVVKYGFVEGNGVIFFDKNDVWYMEIVIGYYWVVQ